MEENLNWIYRFLPFQNSNPDTFGGNYYTDSIVVAKLVIQLDELGLYIL